VRYFEVFRLSSCSSGSNAVTRVLVPQLNNFTFTFPPSPLLTQASDVAPDLICRQETPPPRCEGSPICECVHVIDLPLGATVELILLDLGNKQQRNSWTQRFLSANIRARHRTQSWATRTHLPYSLPNYFKTCKMAAFSFVHLCSLVEVYWRFRGTCCRHLQGDSPW
jgi:hypothetical protein